MEPDSTAEVWQIALTAEGPGPLPEQRLRRALKALLRQCGLRCVWLGPALCRECLNPVTKTRRGKRHAKPVRAAG